MEGRATPPGDWSDTVRSFLDRELRGLLQSSENLRALLRLADPALAEALDFSRMEVVPRDHLLEDLRERAVDALVRLPYRAGDAGEPGAGVLVYLLAEHQSAKNLRLAPRLLRFMARIWDWEWEEQRKAGRSDAEVRLHPVIPLVFYTGEGGWERVVSLGELIAAPPDLARFVPAHEVLFVHLGRTPEDALLRADRFFGALLLLLRGRGAPGEVFRDLVRRAGGTLAELAGLDERRWRRLLLAALRISQFYRDVDEQPALTRAIAERYESERLRTEVIAMGNTYAEKLLSEGWHTGRAEGEARGEAKGRADGEAKGEAKGRAEDVLRILERRFGPVPAALHGKVAAAPDLATLDRLFDLALAAASLDDFAARA
jgi:hypothetical protein